MDKRFQYAEKISIRLNSPLSGVIAALDLLESANTIPFIARYRKESTGNLDEVQIKDIKAEYKRLKTLEKRRSFVLRKIADQAKLEPALQKSIQRAGTLTELEDFYRPYRPKRQTRASIARSQGLEPLARMILEQPVLDISRSDLVKGYISSERPTEPDVWQGARDIAAEAIGEHPHVRRVLREKALRWGRLLSKRKTSSVDERRIFERYYLFEQKVDQLAPHQVLAINRGEKEKVISVHIEIPERDWREAIFLYYKINPSSLLSGELMHTAEETMERLLLPAIERDVRQTLSAVAGKHAIDVFAENLRALLSQPPLVGHTVLGIDPGFRTGCKLAVVDPTGKVLETGTIYPHAPQNQRELAINQIKSTVSQFRVSLIAIGNGTASRETEALVAELTRIDSELHYLIVDEAGASVYSASDLARKELPHMDVTLRGAVSIARRAQDPLAEIVKIDPKSIGVGLYQHDVNQADLDEALNSVGESVVNQVGVDVNTASPALLQLVAGVGPKLAQSLVSYRDIHGPFPNRLALKSVKGLGQKAFEQAAGFLRVRGGDQPLDDSAIHPESYPAAEALLVESGVSLGMTQSMRSQYLDRYLSMNDLGAVAQKLRLGLATLEDILFQLRQPGRDPREDVPPPLLRRDIISVNELAEGMRLSGTVRNVVDFGAFIDIGVKLDGLLHQSQIPPDIRISVGDIIQVTIKKLEIERGRISLGWGN